MVRKSNKNELENKPNSFIEELSPKWASFVEFYLAGNSGYQAAIKSGFSEDYARVITTRFPEKVRKSLHDALDAKGITSDKIAEKINNLLDREEPMAIDKGITHAIKIGVGGGYAPEKSVTLTVNVESPDRLRELAKRLGQSLG